MREQLTITIAILVSLSIWAPSAEAQLFSGDSGGDTIIIGMIKAPGTSTVRAWGCVDTGANGIWHALGNEDGLTASGWVDGAGGPDIMFIAKDGTVPPNCVVSGQSWDELLYQGHWIDLYGGAGNDNLHDGGGGNDTHLSGQGDNDTCYQYSTIGHVNGGDGVDNLYAYSAGTTDSLYGEGGDDCLYTSDGLISPGNFLCGDGGSDKTNELPRPADCEITVSSC